MVSCSPAFLVRRYSYLITQNPRGMRKYTFDFQDLIVIKDLGAAIFIDYRCDVIIFFKWSMEMFCHYN